MSMRHLQILRHGDRSLGSEPISKQTGRMTTAHQENGALLSSSPLNQPNDEQNYWITNTLEPGAGIVRPEARLASIQLSIASLPCLTASS
jgi:hypothetical protein